MLKAVYIFCCMISDWHYLACERLFDRGMECYVYCLEDWPKCCHLRFNYHMMCYNMMQPILNILEKVISIKHPEMRNEA